MYSYYVTIVTEYDKIAKEYKENVEREEGTNPFREYAVRKGIVGRASLDEDYSPSLSDREKRYSPQEELALNLANNWDSMNVKYGSLGFVWTGPHLETSDSGAIFDWKLADRSKGYLNFLRDSRLSNLPNVANDGVAEKLEGFKNRLGEDFYAYNLRYDEAQQVLAKISFAYDNLVDRSMNQETYESLENSTYEEFRDKTLKGTVERRSE